MSGLVPFAATNGLNHAPSYIALSEPNSNGYASIYLESNERDGFEYFAFTNSLGSSCQIDSSAEFESTTEKSFTSGQSTTEPSLTHAELTSVTSYTTTATTATTYRSDRRKRSLPLPSNSSQCARSTVQKLTPQFMSVNGDGKPDLPSLAIEDEIECLRNGSVLLV